MPKPRIGQLTEQPRREARYDRFALWNVPHARNPYFTGREDIIEQLRKTLVGEGGAALSQAAAIRGLGGGDELGHVMGSQAQDQDSGKGFGKAGHGAFDSILGSW